LQQIYIKLKKIFEGFCKEARTSNELFMAYWH
jgi:hypothetical protein